MTIIHGIFYNRRKLLSRTITSTTSIPLVCMWNIPCTPIYLGSNNVTGPFPASSRQYSTQFYFRSSSCRQRCFSRLCIRQKAASLGAINALPTIFLPECASDKSNTLIPLSTARTMICSACSSVTFGLNVGHVPGEERKELRIVRAGGGWVMGLFSNEIRTEANVGDSQTAFSQITVPEARCHGGLAG